MSFIHVFWLLCVDCFFRLTADIVVASKLALLDLLDRFRSLFDELVDAQLEQTPQNESSLSGKDADANSLTEGVTQLLYNRQNESAQYK